MDDRDIVSVSIAAPFGLSLTTVAVA